MIGSIYRHSVAPKRVIRGDMAWRESEDTIRSICKRPLLLGRSRKTRKIRDLINKRLYDLEIKPTIAELEFDCCEIDLARLKEIAEKNSCDAVIAAGGGKVLDAGKLLSHRIYKPCITVPLSAATCAGWTALSNIYSPQGAFEKDQVLQSSPELLIFDHEFIKQAPPKTLASGIADALAKWYEASITSGSSNDGLIQQAVQMARVLRDQLLLEGYEAFKNVESKSWVTVAEGCALTAGLIGGIGGARCRGAAAHALHNGLTQITTSNRTLHGEIVGLGILTQLRLEETLTGSQLAKQARLQLIPFMKKLCLPTTLDTLSLENIPLNELQNACQFACKPQSEIYNLPFSVDPTSLMEALKDAGNEKAEVKTICSKGEKIS